MSRNRSSTRSTAHSIHRQIYVDESKFRDYLLIAIQLEAAELSHARRVVQSLRSRSQTHIHMKDERTQRKKVILDAFSAIRMKVVVYRAPKQHSSELKRRESCLLRLISDALEDGVGKICLDRDETLLRFDRQVFIEALRSVDVSMQPMYWHSSGNSEPLLALPDAMVWAWARGNDWRQACLRLNIREVIVP